MKTLKTLFFSENVMGLLLVSCMIASLVLANSFVKALYLSFWQFPVFGWSLTHGINDGLMTAFFLLVGLEIKRELLQGELATPKKAMLPIAAAIGGMIGPAAIYLGFNYGHLTHGWGIPIATDIVFALAVLSILGKQVPVSLKVFLTAFAIVDDLGAKMEHWLKKPVHFFILPLFILANTAIALQAVAPDTLISRMSLGIILGLGIGKPVGILLFCWLALRFKMAHLPGKVRRNHLIGVAFLGGIGFTMSIFIALLSFEQESLQNGAKLAILIGSIGSAAVGYFILKWSRN